jgi:superfamily II DNA or RNA helicase
MSSRSEIVEKVVRGELDLAEAAVELRSTKASVESLVQSFLASGRKAVADAAAYQLPALPNAGTPLTLEHELNRLTQSLATTWPDQAALRRCQVSAFQALRLALREFKEQGSRDKDGAVDRGHYVIQMATGAGKTGVIACASYALPEVSKTLVVVPTDALRSQLERELNSGGDRSFWSTTGLKPGQPRAVRAVEGLELEKLKIDPKSILITTIQSLQSRYAASEKMATAGQLLKRLRLFDLVIFDEGHRKPAKAWDVTIDALETPLLLLTATPYRADGKALNARPIYSFTLADAAQVALASRFLRGAVFRELDYDVGASGYAAALAERLAQVTAASDKANERPRMIVRGAGRQQVEDLLSAFRDLHHRDLLPTPPVAIHSTFASDPPAGRLRTTTTIPEDAQVLIHEDMLLEGYDDPRVLLIALPTLPHDTTVLVQQIGRALRRKREWEAERQLSATIFVPAPRRTAESVWASYQRFERNPNGYEVRGGEFLPVSGSLRSLKDEDELQQLIRVRPSIRAYDLRGASPALSTLRKHVNQRVDDLGFSRVRSTTLSSKEHPEAQGILTFFERPKRPDFLVGGHLDIVLGLVCVVLTKKHAFIASSDSATLDPYEKAWKEVTPDRLLALLPKDANVQSIRLRNLDTGEGTVRAKSMIADHSERHLSSVRDGGFAAQSLAWWNPASKNAHREAISISSGMFGSSSRLTVTEFLAWCAATEARLQAGGKAEHPILERVAERFDAPGKLTPYLVRIDFDDDVAALVPSTWAGNRWEDRSTEAVVPESTSLFAELKEFRSENAWAGPLTNGTGASGPALKNGLPAIKVTKSKSNNGLTLKLGWRTSAGLRMLVDGEMENLARWAASNSRFVVHADEGVFFRGNFYRRAELSPAVAEALVVPCSAFDRCKTEVKPGTHGRPWLEESLFHVIESEFRKPKKVPDGWKNIDLLICDDASGETADFLAFDFTPSMPRIVMLHAKCAYTKPDPGESEVFSRLRIDDLYVVLAQATKNAFHLWETPTDDRLARWKEDHHAGCKRIRFGESRLGDVAGLIRNPRTRREVWVVQSMFAATSLLKQVTLPPQRRSLNARRMLQLIEHTAGAIADKGALFQLIGNGLST